MLFKKLIHSKKHIHRMLKTHSLSWLQENSKTEPLSELFELCDSEKKLFLVCELLERFFYINIERRKEYISLIAHKIVKEWKLDSNNTLLSSIVIGSKVDSSHQLLQIIKPVLSKLDWNCNTVNRFSDVLRKDYSKYENIVIIDEFLGSGTTISNRINILRRERKTFRLRACYLAGMEDGCRIAEQECDDLFVCQKLKKGIGDHYADWTKRQTALETMLSLEDTLDKTNDVRKLIFPFGFKASEALYAMDEGNTVNNLFPIFWWKWNRKSDIRNTLFYRKGIYSDDR